MGTSLFLHSIAKQNNPDGHVWFLQLTAVAHEVISSAKEVAQYSPITSVVKDPTDIFSDYVRFGWR